MLGVDLSFCHCDRLSYIICTTKKAKRIFGFVIVNVTSFIFNVKLTASVEINLPLFIVYEKAISSTG